MAADTREFKSPNPRNAVSAGIFLAVITMFYYVIFTARVARVVEKT
jgi:hypothetical protein